MNNFQKESAINWLQEYEKMQYSSDVLDLSESVNQLVQEAHRIIKELAEEDK